MTSGHPNSGRWGTVAGNCWKESPRARWKCDCRGGRCVRILLIDLEALFCAHGTRSREKKSRWEKEIPRKGAPNAPVILVRWCPGKDGVVRSSRVSSRFHGPAGGGKRRVREPRMVGGRGWRCCRVAGWLECPSERVQPNNL